MRGLTPTITPNALNQYSNIAHPNFVDVSGTANPLASVTVNGIAAARQSDYFYHELTENNTEGPQWIEATITDGTVTTNGSLSLTAIATNPVYDDDGNLTSDGEWIYTWDAENRLIGLERSAGALAAGTPYHRVKHDYDSQSRRISTTLFINNGTTPSSQTRYIFDGWKCIAEIDASGQPIRKYTWGLDLANRIDDAGTGNVGGLLWLVDSATNKAHIHLYDRNGNVTGLADAVTRKRSATYEYDAFGKLLTCYGDYAKLNPFTFSTKFTDFSTGLCYYGYRWYSPRDGRWPSRDPIEEKGGVNLYGMCLNNCVSLIDTHGEAPMNGGVGGPQFIPPGGFPPSRPVAPTPPLPDFFPEDPTKSNEGGFGIVHHNYHKQSICYIGDASTIRREIFEKLKDFSLFNGNSTNHTAYLNKKTGVVTFSPPASVQTGMRLASVYDAITVKTTNDAVKHEVYARTTGSHFLVGNRTWGVNIYSSDYKRGAVYTHAAEQFASIWFKSMDVAASFLKSDFESQVPVIWSDYLNNITDEFVRQKKITKEGKVEFKSW